MLEVSDFFSLIGQVETPSTAESAYVTRQLLVGAEAVRNYINRHCDLFYWEDRFVNPNIVNLRETPIQEIVSVVADGRRLVIDRDVFFDPNTGRLFNRTGQHDEYDDNFGDWGSAYNGGSIPSSEWTYTSWGLPVRNLKVLYKAGFDPMPAILQQVVADYTYERLLLYRAATSSGGGVAIPTGTISSIAIEGVGTIKYASGGTTTSSGSVKSTGGQTVLGLAGTLLDAYRDIAPVVPGLTRMISHRPAIEVGTLGDTINYSDADADAFAYSDDPHDVVVFSNNTFIPPAVLNTQLSNVVYFARTP